MRCGKIARLSRKINQNQWKFALMRRLALFSVPLVVKPQIHAMVEYSDIVWQGNVIDMAAEWFTGILNDLFKDDPCK
jgi:hypothetical protein